MAIGIGHTDEDYFTHMRRAFGFALVCIGWSLQAAIHGVIPLVFQHTTDKARRYMG